MVAVPYRAELGARLAFRALGILLAFAVAVAMIAVAGRLDDLNLSWFDAIWVPAAVLVATTTYALSGRRLGEQLPRMRALDSDAERVAPAPVRWGRLLARALVGGLVVGGIALVLDFEVDGLAVVLAIALGGSLGDEGFKVVTLTRHERDHGGTVYRIEDPPGTEAGLAWLPRGGE